MSRVAASRPNYVGASLWLALIFGSAGVGVWFLPTFRHIDPAALGLGYLTCAVCLAGVAVATIRGFRPVATVFYTFTLAWLGIAPLIQMQLGQAAWNDWAVVIDPKRTRVALLLGLVMLCCFQLGIWLTPRTPSRTTTTAPQPIRKPLLAVLIAGLVVMAPVVIHMQGGLDVLFSDRSNRTKALESAGVGPSNAGGGLGTGFAVLLPAALALAICHLSLFSLRCRLNQRRVDWRYAISGFIGFGGLLLFANPNSSTRFIAAIAFGSVLLAVLRPKSALAGTVCAILGLIVVVFGYPLFGQIQSLTSGSIGSVSSSWSASQAMTTGDFDGFQQTINTVSYVGYAGSGRGHHVLSAVLFFVPRSIWAAKTDPGTFEVSRFAGYWFTDLSLPIHAELYLDFGWIGVVLGSLLLGLVVGRLDDSWLNHPASVEGVLAPVGALSTLAVLRGPLGSLVPSYMPAILILAGAWGVNRLWCRLKLRRIVRMTSHEAVPVNEDS